MVITDSLEIRGGEKKKERERYHLMKYIVKMYVSTYVTTLYYVLTVP